MTNNLKEIGEAFHTYGIRYNVIVESDFNFNVKKVIFNKPATIVYWEDGTKTVVKCQNGDTFNPETGIAMCFMKKARGNKSNFNNVFKKFINSEEIKNEGSEESKT